MDFHLYKDGDLSPATMTIEGDPAKMRAAVLALLKVGFEIAARPVYITPPAHLAGIEDPTPADYRLRIWRHMGGKMVQMVIDGHQAGLQTTDKAIEFLFSECLIISLEQKNG